MGRKGYITSFDQQREWMVKRHQSIRQAAPPWLRNTMIDGGITRSRPRLGERRAEDHKADRAPAAPAPIRDNPCLVLKPRAMIRCWVLSTSGTAATSLPRAAAGRRVSRGAEKVTQDVFRSARHGAHALPGGTGVDPGRIVGTAARPGSERNAPGCGRRACSTSDDHHA